MSEQSGLDPFSMLEHHILSSYQAFNQLKQRQAELLDEQAEAVRIATKPFREPLRELESKIGVVQERLKPEALQKLAALTLAEAPLFYQQVFELVVDTRSDFFVHEAVRAVEERFPTSGEIFRNDKQEIAAIMGFQDTLQASGRPIPFLAYNFRSENVRFRQNGDNRKTPQLPERAIGMLDAAVGLASGPMEIETERELLPKGLRVRDVPKQLVLPVRALTTVRSRSIDVADDYQRGELYILGDPDVKSPDTTGYVIREARDPENPRQHSAPRNILGRTVGWTRDFFGHSLNFVYSAENVTATIESFSPAHEYDELAISSLKQAVTSLRD